jgi:hypothetical protein
MKKLSAVGAVLISLALLTACGQTSEVEKKEDVPSLATIARECDVHFFYKQDDSEKWSLNAVTQDEFDCVVEKGTPTNIADEITKAQSSGEKKSGKIEENGYSYQWSLSGVTPHMTINEL